MKVEDTKGAPITNLADWAKLYDSPRSSHQWKEGRSAYSAAEFIINRNGAESLRARVSDALREPVVFDRIVPEHEVRFDQFGHGRMHDLAVFGKTSSGQTLFVGVEAKVDEPFGASVRDAYLAAKSRHVEAVQEVALETSKTMAQVALAWVLSHSEVTVAITGGDTVEHLEDNVGALDWKLPSEHRKRLDEVSQSMGRTLN